MVKIGLLGVTAVLLALQFKSGKQEYGIYLALGTIILIFLYALDKMGVIIDALNVLEGYLGIHSSYFTILYKIVGITYVAEFSSGICKDAGYSSIAGQIELVGKLTILTISMPIVLSLLDSISGFLKA